MDTPAMREDKKTFIAAHRIAKIFHVYQQRLGLTYFPDTRGSLPNHDRNQTVTGLYLCYHNHLAYSVWTPWGEWVFRKKGVAPPDIQWRLHDAVRSQMTVKDADALLLSRDRREHRSLSSVVAVAGRTRVIVPPEPTLKTDWLKYKSAEQVQAEWSSLMRRTRLEI